MKFNELNLTKKTDRKRVGRGISGGGGKTAGRGTKGQKARTGKKLRPGFEGGQNPLMSRIPKLKGFKAWRAKSQVVYTGNLSELGLKNIDNHNLFEAGMIADPYHSVKIVVRGEIKKALNVSVQSATRNAISAIESAGGAFKAVEVPKREAKKSDKESK